MVEILQAAYLDYKKKCIPEGEAEHVLIERRRMFMAGAMAVMDIMANISDNATEDEGVAVLKLVTKELKQNGTWTGTPEEARRA